MKRPLSWRALSQVERLLLASRVVLDSFGSARTHRNANSSRVGTTTKVSNDVSHNDFAS